MRAANGALECPVQATFDPEPETRKDAKVAPGTAAGDMRYDGGR